MDENTGCGCGCLTVVIIVIACICYVKIDFSVFSDLDFDELKEKFEYIMIFSVSLSVLIKLSLNLLNDGKQNDEKVHQEQENNLVAEIPETKDEQHNKLPELRWCGIPNKKEKYYSSEYALVLIDNLTFEKSTSEAGAVFEKIVRRLLEAHGFRNVKCTKASGDYGADVIAEFEGEMWAIQCKCHKSNISNKAVQEIYTAQKIYNCNRSAVFTNRYFTDSAIKTAGLTGVELLDRDTLIEYLNDLSSYDLKYITNLCESGSHYYRYESYCEKEYVTPNFTSSYSTNEDVFSKYRDKYIQDNRERESERYQK